MIHDNKDYNQLVSTLNEKDCEIRSLRNRLAEKENELEVYKKESARLSDELYKAGKEMASQKSQLETIRKQTLEEAEKILSAFSSPDLVVLPREVVEEAIAAFQKAEELYQIGILNSPTGLPDEVAKLRRSALSKLTEAQGN